MKIFYSRTTGGFYFDNHHKIIPEDAKEISQSTYEQLLAVQPGGCEIQADAEGLPIAVRPAPPSLDELKAARLAELNKDSQSIADQLTAGYPEFEKLTWEDQRRDVAAWLADPNAATPYIDAIAAERGIDRIDLLNRTNAKVDAFKAASQKLVGQRQRYEDQIMATASPEALDAISSVFSLG